MQLVLVAHGGGAAFQIADVATLFGNDQRAFELAGVFRIDAEIGGKLHRASNAFWNVHEGSVGEDRGVEAGEIVVALRHDLAQPLFHQVRMLLQCFADGKEDDACLLQFLAESGRDGDGVEHRIHGYLARTLYACQHFLLRHGNAKLVVNGFDLGIELIKRIQLNLLLGRGVIVGVLIVDFGIAELGPVRFLHLLPQAEGFQAPVQHPFRLVLLARNEADGVLGQALFRIFGFDIGRPAMLVFSCLVGGLARLAVFDFDLFVHAISSVLASCTSETSASALRKTEFTIGQCGCTEQLPSSAQSCRPPSTQEVSAIGPSIASTMSAKLIAAAGRASCSPPPAPRAERSKPAAVSLLTTFCTVGTGRPDCSANSAALVRPPPQWRAAWLIVTTA